MAYYNEHDSFAAAWLRNLAADGLIQSGQVDARDIQAVQPSDLADSRCHFFAGIGGWDYALQLAGWPADRPVWTGSCPCQPFSAAGKGQGFADTRHLWPTWFRLIRECRPAVIFGEQVASPTGLAWFDHVATDLETEGYAVGAADLSAASVGAPHIRQRLFFVADSVSAGRAEGRSGSGGRPIASSGGAGLVADSQRQRDGDSGSGAAGAETQGMQGADRKRERFWPDAGRRELLGNSSQPGLEGRGLSGRERGGQRTAGRAGSNAWADAIWLPCRDGKARPIPTQPELFPLAHGIPNRVGTLRGAGNAIVPQVAAEFIRAYLDIGS